MSVVRNGRNKNHRVNPLKSLSVADLYHNVNAKQVKHINKVSPGTGPSTFTEQGVRVMTVFTKAPENIRASHFEECTVGNWMPNLDNPDEAYSIQKNEICWRVIDPSENASRVKEIRAGTPYTRIQTSGTNLKDEVEIEVLGLVMNPSVARGRGSSGNDPAATLQYGGTGTMPNSGQYRIRVGDHLYGFKEGYTVPKGNDPSGKSGYVTCCPMKGIHREKILLQPVPLGPMSIDQMIKSHVFEWITKTDELIHVEGGGKAPSGQAVKTLISELNSTLENEPQSKIPNFISFLKMQILVRIIRHATSLEVSNPPSAHASDWKKLAGQCGPLLADLLKKYYDSERKKIPHYIQTLNWKQKLPFVLDHEYNEAEIWKNMSMKTKKPMTHMHHILLAADRCIQEIPPNINRTLSKLFIGTALTGAEKTYPIDIDVKRY